MATASHRTNNDSGAVDRKKVMNEKQRDDALAAARRELDIALGYLPQAESMNYRQAQQALARLEHHLLEALRTASPLTWPRAEAFLDGQYAALIASRTAPTPRERYQCLRRSVRYGQACVDDIRGDVRELPLPEMQPAG
jgi:hypothetical protein